MKKIYITTILIIVILLMVNLLSNEYHFRFDLTASNQYTLSDATDNILHNLEEPVTVKAYFSKDLPSGVAKTRKDFQEMLIEYSNKADGMLQYEFIDPSEKESIEQEAVQNGIQPLMINVREKDQVKQQKAFLGALISIGTKHESIPFLQPGAAMEYALSTAIKKLSVTDKPVVGFLQGHGEPAISELSQLNMQLGVLYSVQGVTLSDTSDIPATVKSLVIIRPTDSIPASHFAKIDAFVARGGGVAVAINRVTGDLQNASGQPLSTGLENWLLAKGIEVQPDFIVDAKCGSVTMQQQTAFGMMQSQIPFPYLPIVARFADHPVTKGLETVVLQFVSSVKFVGDTSRHFTPLIFSSERSNTQNAPLYFDVQKQWTQADLPLNGIVMGGALEGPLAGNVNARLIVIADGDFPINGSSQQQQRIQPDNVNLLSNGIDWLSDDTGLIDLRTKGVTARPIMEMEDGTKTIIKYTNFLLPLVMVLIYGLVRFQQNRMRRLKRMSENYEAD